MQVRPWLQQLVAWRMCTGQVWDLPTLPLTCALRRTVMFVDEAGQQVSEKRLQLVQG